MSMLNSENRTADECATTQTDQVAAWFNEARFGLFMHWGIYALLAHESAEWVMFKEDINRNEYNRLASQFTATHFDADAIAALAKRAGMRYMMLTARHHDGFCLFDTQTTDFNSVKTAAKRDLIGEYVEACRRANLRVGLYYSIMSWQHSAIYDGPNADRDAWDKMVQETHDQVRELMTNYGKIDMLWYDGAIVPRIQDNIMVARFWRGHELNAMVRELQPEILINDRVGLPEDFSTPEQRVHPPASGRAWEACITLNRSWGYNIHDRDFKSPHQIIEHLIRCARFGGNLLLNIGLRSDGSVQSNFTERLEAVGRWLKRNGQSIYNSQRSAYTEAEHIAGPVTQKGKQLYIHLAKQPSDALILDAVGEVADARLLGDDTELTLVKGLGKSVEISGFSAEAFTQEYAVLAVALKELPSNPARLLGGGNEPRMLAGNAPVLGEDVSAHDPPCVPVRTGDAIAELLCRDEAYSISLSENWCRGWINWQVFSPASTGEIQIKLKVPVQGKYNLAIGLISTDTDAIELTLDGKVLDNTLNAANTLENIGSPDTWLFSGLQLEAGSPILSLQGAGHFGLYALQLVPVLQSVPSECWHTIGPFPTEFTPQKPLSEVRKAMDKAFLPTQIVDLNAKYVGTDSRQVVWMHHFLREGDYAEHGVNFPYRCGIEVSGVCYACTTIDSPENMKVIIMLGCDWWANFWVNGQIIKSDRDLEACQEDGSQFNTWKPRAVEVELQKGENIILVKCHPGGTGNRFTFRISSVAGLTIGPDI